MKIETVQTTEDRIAELEQEVTRLNKQIHDDADGRVSAVIFAKRVVTYINEAEMSMLERKAKPIPGWLHFLRGEAQKVLDQIEVKR